MRIKTSQKAFDAIAEYNRKTSHLKGFDATRARCPVLAHNPCPDTYEIVRISGVQVMRAK